jgi:hypothetical protein
MPHSNPSQPLASEIQPSASEIQENDVLARTSRAGLSASLTEQLDWTLASLGLRCATVDSGRLTIEPAEESVQDAAYRSDASATSLARRTSDSPSIAALPAEVSASPASVSDWLRLARKIQAQHGSGVWEGQPNHEPNTVREVATPLLAPFQVREGHVSLAGCTLEDRPSLRIGVVESRHGEASVRFSYFGPDGSAIDDRSLDQKGLNQVHTVAKRLRQTDHASIDRWMQAVEPQLEVAGAPALDIVDVSVLWSRWAAGKIVVQFTQGPSVSIPFAGWARDYVAGRLAAPMFRCPASGLTSYEVISLDDGTVTVPNAIGKCAISGRERLLTDLDTCQLTHQLVSRELLQRCASTGQWVLADKLTTCQWCERKSSPEMIVDQRCQNCRAENRLASDDVRLKPFLAVHQDAVAKLGKLSRWQGWLDDQRGVLVGGNFWQQTFYVIDCPTGKIVRSGFRMRPWGKWQTTERLSD